MRDRIKQLWKLDGFGPLAEATERKAYLAEKYAAPIRVLVIALNIFVYFFVMDRTGTIPGLANSIIVVASVYSLFVLFFQPYRRFPILLSGYFTSVSDAVLITLWLLATGGIKSPFYVLWYVSIVAIALRYSYRATLLVAALYAASYLALVAALGQFNGHLTEVIVRTSYIFFVGALGGLLARETLSQTQVRIELGRLISQSLDPERVGQWIVDSTRMLFGALAVSLFRLEPGSEDLIVVAVSGDVGPTYGPNLVFPRGTGVVGLAVRERQPVATPDVLVDPRIVLVPEVRVHIERAPARAVLVVPLIVKDMVIGALGIADRAGRVFNDEEIQLAQTFADQAAMALESARLYEESRQLQETTAMLEIAIVLSSTLELEPLLKGIAQKAAQACKMDRCSIFFWEGERVIPVTSQLADDRADQPLWDAFKQMGRMEVHEIPFFGEAIRRREPVVIHHPATDPLMPRSLDVAQATALLVVPLIRQDKVVGAMALDNTQRARPVTSAQVALATTIASQVALALENTRLYDEARTRASALAALLDVSRELSQVQPLPSLLGRIAEACGRLLGTDSVGIRLVEGDDLVIGGVWGDAKEAMFTPRIKVGESITGIVAATGEILLVTDPANDARLIQPHREAYRRLGVRAFLGVPVKVGDQVAGVLSIRTKRERGFSAQDMALATAFAVQAAVALENARLYDEARQALADLKVAQDRLVQSEKFRALAEMAGGVAHDFNNLLTVILGRAQHLLPQLEEGKANMAQVRRSLTLIERAALDGAETVRRILEFTRARPRPGEAVAVDINELLSQTVEASRHRWKDEAEAKGRQIHVVIETGNLPPVMGSPAELREVLLNLIFNGIDAMPEGGTLTLSSWAQQDTVCLAVTDTGVGIPEEVRSRIFDPFFTTKGPQASGLGLSVSYGIVRRHGGEINVKSQPGAGTTFTIRLPVRVPQAPRVEEASAASVAQLRILVIDDQAPVREMFRDMLASAGHEVYEAGSGPEGLELLERQRVDVVCTDLGMPGMTGWEVADRIKARWPEMKVALVTGWGARVEPDELEVHGVDLLITKPVEMKELLNTLSRLAGSEPAAKTVSRGNGP
jgi:signal transduction histidine kinase/ActR/RegA family two-component response regulator